MRSGLISTVAVLAIAAATAAAAEAPPIAAYGHLPAMEQVQIAPSGGAYAYIGAAGAKRFVVVRSADDGKVLQTVDTNAHKLRLLRWADDRHLLIVFSGTEDFGGYGKAELPAVMLANIATHRLSQLVPSEDGLRGAPMEVSHKGDHAYGWFPGEKDTIKRVDLDSGQVVTATTLPPRVGGVALSPDGVVLARIETTDNGQAWSVLAGADSRRTLASGRNAHGEPDIESFGRTAKTILFTRPEDGDFEAPRELDLVSGEISEPLVKGADSRTWRDRRSRLLIGFHVDGETPMEVFFDPKTQARWESVKAAFPHETVSLESFDDDMARWIVRTEGAHDSGRYFLIDLATSKAIALGAAYPDVKPQDVAGYSWFHYKAADGAALSAVLTLPPGVDLAQAHRLPVIVLPHGGPAAHDDLHFDWWPQAIASRGYAVLQPNFRGSTGYGQQFERAGWGQWGRTMQTDVSDGLRALAVQGVVDPKRACIVGWSYGGYATLAGITVQNGIYRCAAAGGAVSDLAGMLNYEYDRTGKSSGVMRYWKASMALQGAHDPKAAAFSPARLAGRADAPLLLLHGKDDTVVPFAQAEEMLDAMHAAHKPVEIAVLSGEDHWLSSGETRTRMLEAMIGFLEKNNPPT